MVKVYIWILEINEVQNAKNINRTKKGFVWGTWI